MKPKHNIVTKQASKAFPSKPFASSFSPLFSEENKGILFLPFLPSQSPI